LVLYERVVPAIKDHEIPGGKEVSCYDSAAFCGSLLVLEGISPWQMSHLMMKFILYRDQQRGLSSLYLFSEGLVSCGAIGWLPSSNRGGRT